jgi:phosphohistidine phosphatase SixA
MHCEQPRRDAAVQRRKALLLLAASALSAIPCHATGHSDNAAAHTSDSGRKTVAGLLRAGGCAVLLRHAATDPGVGDPPDFKLEACSTQRNLSVAGREDAQRIGAWFRSNALTPRAVLSSAWCRCKDTADLAFGKHAVWSALNSTFTNRGLQPEQTVLMRQALARIPARQFEVWVTHQVNISAIADQGTSMGEALVLSRDAKVLARTTFE